MSKPLNLLLFFLIVIGSFTACKNEVRNIIDYERLKANVLHDSFTTVNLSDSMDIFDQEFYDPEKGDFYVYLDSLEKMYENDSSLIKKAGVDSSNILDRNSIIDSAISNKKDSFTNKINQITAEEIKALKYNLKQLHDADSILKSSKEVKKGKENSRVWARISKTDQRLYLSIDGKIVDTFKVSTGSKNHETPLFDMQPRGPIFQKYSSRKYPGGNYNGLGNMPYVVFIQNGYGVHGTTLGNIPRLGTKASHGCIRVHPDNAKIFNELVRRAGLENTWITVEK
jgi:lipoprotein-anchoring transpeptidase ErfK/SrfK